MYHTFGCKLNFSETASIERSLQSIGVETVTEGESPDVIVVNSCSVTEVADKKCRQYLRWCYRNFPSAGIVVTGCFAQLKSEEIAQMPGVVIVAGAETKKDLPRLVSEWIESGRRCIEVTPHRGIRTFAPSCAKGNRTRYFLKVQDGCNYYCSYCTIPLARGNSRSGRISDIVGQARKVADEGGREIVLTGVNVGDFGNGTEESFFDLVKALDGVEGIDRYRISSIEPNLLTDEIIEWVANSRRFMPHFHIPLQSGSDEVLRLMRRRYDTGLFKNKVSRIRELIPDAFIGVDLIVGMRGETAELFNEGLDFVKSLDISRLHVFPYSERPGTRAVSDIPLEVSHIDKQQRSRLMGDVSVQKLNRFMSDHLGTVRSVLAEHSFDGEGRMCGFTDNYMKVRFHAPESAANTMLSVRLDSIDHNEIIGTVI